MLDRSDTRARFWRTLLVLSGLWIVLAAVPATAQTAPGRQVTFYKDVLPILQRSCQSCHHPNSIAPMSLITYEEARPYARSMKQRTALARSPYGRGAMPPWFIEKNIGIQKYKDDPSLSDAEIALIAAWADNGAPAGNSADALPPRQFAGLTDWSLGKPDMIVSSPRFTIKGIAADWWGEVDDWVPQPIKLTEDRYIESVEYQEVPIGQRADSSKGTVGARWIFHHAQIIVDNNDGTAKEHYPFYEVGRNGDVFPQDTGRPLKQGANIEWGELHAHAPGLPGDRTSRLDVGIRLHPKGYKPKYDMKSTGSFGKSEIEVNANEANQRAETFYVLQQPTRLKNFEPHLHAAGVRMCMDAIYERAIETLSCSGYHHNWVINYDFDDNYAPLLPKGTIVRATAWFDSTANNTNIINPENQNNWARRSVGNMFMVFNYIVPLTDEQYQEELAKRRAYLDRTDGWGTVIGCPACWDRPVAAPAAATATPTTGGATR